jgi:hypothetical protein
MVVPARPPGNQRHHQDNNGYDDDRHDSDDDNDHRRRPRTVRNDTSSSIPTKVLIYVGFLVVVMYLATSGGGNNSSSEINNEGDSSQQQRGLRQMISTTLQSSLLQQRAQLSKALQSLNHNNLPARLKNLRDKHLIVGERMIDIKHGKETVHEILQGATGAANMDFEGEEPPKEDKKEDIIKEPPMTLPEIVTYLDNWIHTLHEKLGQAKYATFEGIWQVYHDLAVQTLYPWDREYLRRMPPRRDDGSIFLSLATYRDENCFNVR